MKKIIEFYKNNLAFLLHNFYPKIGRRGYERYKNILIKKKINNQNIIIKKNLDERIIEIPWIILNLRNLKGNLLDAGSTLNNEYIIKKLKNFKVKIFTTLYPEKNYYNYLGASYTYEDFVDLSFKSDYFDVISCISTLEHIGFDNEIYNYGKFKKRYKKKNHLNLVIKNFKRVLKNNGKFFVSVPFGKKMKYKNMQQFDFKGLITIIKLFKPKNYSIKFYKFSKNMGWIKTTGKKCENILPNVRNGVAISANSIALIKITK